MIAPHLWLLQRTRLTIRVLMVSLMPLAALMGGLANSVRVQRDAVAGIRHAGGTVAYSWEVPDLFRPRQRSKPSWPRGPGWLRATLGPDAFDEVWTVDLSQSVALDDGTIIRSHPSLVLNDEIMAQISQLGSLISLSFALRADAGLSTEGFAKIRKLKRLRSLVVQPDLDSTGFLPHLAGMENLFFLYLGSAKLTEKNIAIVAKLRKLKYLMIDGKHLTDSGLMKLTRLEKLRFLVLIGPCPGITQAGLDRFMAAAPAVNVDKD